jgi:hypothetical protein
LKNWMRCKETIQTNLVADLLLDLDLKRKDWSVVCPPPDRVLPG